MFCVSEENFNPHNKLALDSFPFHLDDTRLHLFNFRVSGSIKWATRKGPHQVVPSPPPPPWIQQKKHWVWLERSTLFTKYNHAHTANKPTNQQTEPISSDCKYSLSCNPRKYFVASLHISTASNNNINNNNIVEPFALPWLQFHDRSSSLHFWFGTFSFFYLNVASIWR